MAGSNGHGGRRRRTRRRSTRLRSSSSASSTPRTSCIEVGVAIVGGGTAGLACANRLLQLLADDPATAWSASARCRSR